MYKLIDVVKSTRPGKKWMAVFEDTDSGRQKRTHFGATGYEDYTQHKDPERAEHYRTRHQKDLKTGDPTRAGFLSYYLLWSSPSFNNNLRAYKKKFNM
jgi:hypothetical protein